MAPIDDPYKRKIARFHLLEKSVCRHCGALNPIRAKKCRRCRAKDLRLKKRDLVK
ncbi:MAG: 50S ribosomal protein L40e [Promethearchaeota archaeon]